MTLLGDPVNPNKNVKTALSAYPTSRYEITFRRSLEKNNTNFKKNVQKLKIKKIKK